MNSIVKDALILFAITVVAGMLLGFTYTITEQPRAEQAIIKRDTALNSVIADATFTELEDVVLDNYPDIKNIFVAKKGEEVVGYAFNLISNKGYGGTIELVAGIDVAGNVTGIDIMKHAETPGLGAKADEPAFKSEFVNKPVATLNVVKGAPVNENDIAAIGGATITSRAVTGAVNVAIDYYNNELAKEAK
jgi:electron transport complex protein RnfG